MLGEMFIELESKIKGRMEESLKIQGLLLDDHALLDRFYSFSVIPYSGGFSSKPLLLCRW